MNVDRILALASLIEKQPHVEPEAKEGFSMSMWSHPCGTPSCIAGWAASMAGWKKISGLSESKAARDYLDIDYETSEHLFLGGSLDLSTITPSKAAATLRHLANTGEINWEAAE